MKHADDEKCPSNEELSAYFDGEECDSSRISAHADHCRECAERLSFFAELADGLKMELDKIADDNFTEKLPDILKGSLLDAPAGPIAFPLFLKVAAMFAGAAIIIISLISDTPDEASPAAPVSTSMEPIVFLGDTAESACGRQTTLRVPSGGESNFNQHAIDASNLTPVATSSRMDESVTRGIPQRGPVNEPESITSEVKQTWSVSNLDSALTRLEKLTRPNVKRSYVRDRAGNLVVKMVLTKKELAEFVRKYSEAGFKLLSPSQPQPEQRVFKGSANSKVSYTAVLVPM